MTSFIRNRENLQWGRNGKGSGDIDDRHFVQQPSTSLQASPPVPALAQPSEDPLARTLLAAVELTSRTLIEHPCRVLRRQCQVHQFARSLHLTPVTLVPVIFNITSKEGLLTLWKGSIGTGVLWGLTSVTEIVFSDLFGLPRTFVPGGSTEKFWRHILLKAVAALTTTPFYISSFIETVRSESGLGGDDNRVMEVLVKGVDRMRFFAFGARDSSRRFSVLHLAIPTVTFRTSHYLIQTFLYEQLYRIARRYVNRKPESERTRYHQYVPQIFATMTSSISTDLILFPFETIIHRMYIQGTRTLIDNLDNGLSAASITIKYNGFFDCFRQTVNKEGFWALYSGVGALCLEYLLHSALHQVLRLCFDRGSEALRRAAAAHHLATTPPLSHATSNLDQMGPLSGPLASQVAMPQEYEEDEYPATSPQHLPSSVPVITSPPLIASPPMRRRPPPQAQAPPPPRRDPMSFPSFGETTSSFGGMESGSSFGNPPFQPPKSSIFGSARSLTPSSSAVWDPLPPLKMDANDPFSG